MVRVANLVKLAAALWLLRWAAREVAAHTANRLPPGPPPLDSERRPGWMPGPSERARRAFET